MNENEYQKSVCAGIPRPLPAVPGSTAVATGISPSNRRPPTIAGWQAFERDALPHSKASEVDMYKLELPDGTMFLFENEQDAIRVSRCGSPNGVLQGGKISKVKCYKNLEEFCISQTDMPVSVIHSLILNDEPRAHVHAQRALRKLSPLERKALKLPEPNE